MKLTIRTAALSALLTLTALAALETSAELRQPARELPLPQAPVMLLEASPDTDSQASSEGCVADAETLCLLEGQVQIRVRFRNQRAGGEEGVGKAVPLGDRTGTFWFFREDNVELVIKALDGRHRNGHYWIFLGSLSDVEFWVEAVAVGEVTVYYNPPGHLFGLADTQALGSPDGPLCGTILGIPCDEGFFCEVVGSCELADGAGSCVPIPEGCTADFSPVCGCDGLTYSNDCHRQSARVQRDHFGPCGDGGSGS